MGQLIGQASRAWHKSQSNASNPAHLLQSIPHIAPSCPFVHLPDKRCTAGLAKGSRLYNRLPSDDHAPALAVDDSAMDLSCQRQASSGARPSAGAPEIDHTRTHQHHKSLSHPNISADPWAPRQHLRTGSSGQITPTR